MRIFLPRHERTILEHTDEIYQLLSYTAGVGDSHAIMMLTHITGIDFMDNYYHVVNVNMQKLDDNKSNISRWKIRNYILNIVRRIVRQQYV